MPHSSHRRLTEQQRWGSAATSVRSPAPKGAGIAEGVTAAVGADQVLSSAVPATLSVCSSCDCTQVHKHRTD